MRFIKNDELNRPDSDSFKSIRKIPVTIVLDNVRSGLNVGSVFRTADAFLIEKIFLCGITACPPNREILKSALGATQTVEWEGNSETVSAIEILKEKKYKIFAIEQCDESIDISSAFFAPDDKIAVVFGNEVRGVSESLIPLLDGCIELNQSGTKHSLNIAVCAGIVCWEFYRNYLKFTK